MTFDAGVNKANFITISDKLKQALIITLQSLSSDFNFADSEIELELKKSNEEVILVTFKRELKDDDAEKLKKCIDDDQFEIDYNKNIKDTNRDVNLKTVSVASKYMILEEMLKLNQLNFKI